MVTKALSPQQAAVLDLIKTGRGSIEVVARAGCGKTFLLLKIVEAVAAMGNSDLILMAYNKSIGDELKSKISALGIDWKVAQAGTCHSFGYAALRKLYPNTKIETDKVRNIINYMHEQEREKSFGDPIPFWNDCSALVERAVSLAKQRAFGHLCKIDDRAAWIEMWEYFDLDSELSELYHRNDVINEAIGVLQYSFSIDRNVIDFDDMILAPLIHKAPFLKKKWVLVDESQDTNAARRALALALLAPGGRMVFVGDDRQAIYGFTGADGNSMSQLKIATNAVSMPLNVTYRCPKVVVQEAQRLVPDITAHPSAPEGKLRSIKVEDLHLETLTCDDAILCRNTAPLVSTAFSLLSRGIPCKVEGRDIGEGLIRLARRWKCKTLAQLSDKLAIYRVAEVKKFTEAKKENLLQHVIDQVECLEVIIARCSAMKKHNVDDLVKMIEDMFGNSSEEVKKVLTLSTIHKSKGREWKRVFTLGRAKYLPSPYARLDWQIVQEANLEYVQLTRAQSELIDIVIG